MVTYNYGLHSKQPPDHGVELEQLKNTFLTSISLTDEDILQLEEDTKGQRLNHLWMKERRQRLTASHFGTVCKMRDTTSCRVTVKSIMYQSSLQTPAIRYGIANEYEKMTNHKDLRTKSPDGVIGQDGLIEERGKPHNVKMEPRSGVYSIDAKSQLVVTYISQDLRHKNNKKKKEKKPGVYWHWLAARCNRKDGEKRTEEICDL
uniref:Uncharacterized protein n=1 Tax=Timema tahoe TaxID=61484 RepID=A0A7R9ILK7_9NEOP|nr:unnamed protein product [Timema tahoe]